MSLEDIRYTDENSLDLIQTLSTSPPCSHLITTASEPEEDDVTDAERYFVMVLLSFLSVIGTGGNALVLYVFSQRRDKLVSTLCILVMAAVDLVTCLVVIPYTIYMEYVRFHISVDVVCRLYQFFITFNIPFSALIMVAIAIDRYFCICHPFWHALNNQRAKLMIAGLGLFSAGLGICVALIYGVYDYVPVPLSEALNGTFQEYSMGDAIHTETSNLLPTFQNESTAMLEKDVSYTILKSQTDTPTIPKSSAPSVEITKHPRDEPTDSTSIISTHSCNETIEIIPTQMVLTNTGQCAANYLILGPTFQETYQKLYSSVFLICVIIVIILYIMIYRALLVRRTRRHQERSKSISLMVATRLTTLQTTAVMMGSGKSKAANGTKWVESEETFISKVEPANQVQQMEEKTFEPVSSGRRSKATGGGRLKMKYNDGLDDMRRLSNKRDLVRMANIKTAAMLFVVTVTFVISYLPALMMALQLVPYNMTIFYMYFANNVANPVIYSFMNQNFRDDTKRIFCRRQ